MSLYFTADLHLGHANIVRYCLRPFLDPDEEQLALADPRGKWRVSPETLARHDDALLAAINDAVQPADTLWILGDFCWGDYAAARRYRDRIRCRTVNFVWGNHDNRSMRDLFGEAIEQGMVAFEGQDIWLNHYPMRRRLRRRGPCDPCEESGLFRRLGPASGVCRLPVLHAARGFPFHIPSGHVVPPPLGDDRGPRARADGERGGGADGELGDHDHEEPRSPVHEVAGYATRQRPA